MPIELAKEACKNEILSSNALEIYCKGKNNQKKVRETIRNKETAEKSELAMSKNIRSVVFIKEIIDMLDSIIFTTAKAE